MLKKIIHSTLISLIFMACQQDKSEFYQAILKTEKGDFRGVSIDENSLKEVKAAENDSFLIDKMDDYLYYDYEINMGNSYTVSYDFSPQNKLYEIEVTTYLDEINDASILLNEFSLFFTEQYGEKRIAEDGFLTWRKENNIEFAMINKSENYGIIIIKIRDLSN